MTITLNWKNVLKFVGVLVLVGVLGGLAADVYQHHQWLHSEIGKLENGTPITRAMLVDALIQKNFTTKPEAPAPIVEAPK